jgi:hypothetical protein
VVQERENVMDGGDILIMQVLLLAILVVEALNLVHHW